MTQLTPELKQQELLAFCEATEWHPQTDRVDETRATTSYDGVQYELLAHAYSNIGGSALKIVFYRQDSDTKHRSYVGALGYHPGSSPYAKVPAAGYMEATLYDILQHTQAA